MAKWNIDSDHSVAAFKARHFMITLVRGQFNKIAGTIEFDPENPALGSVEASIEAVRRLYGDSQAGRPPAQSRISLDAEKFPFIRFKSTGVEKVGVNYFKVAGDLTIRDVTLPVSLDVEYLGQVKDPFEEGLSIGLTASTRINRLDYGVNWNYDMGNGGLVAL